MKIFASWLWVISIIIILLIGEHLTSALPRESEEAVSDDGGGGGAEEDMNHPPNHDHHTDHDQHHVENGAGASASGELSSAHEHHDDHQDAVVPGHGESCGDDQGATCDASKGLVCAEGVCECDKTTGQVFSNDLGKCDAAPPEDIQEVKENSLEDESAAEPSDHHEQESAPATTQAAVIAAAEGHQNSLEEEEEKHEDHDEEHPHNMPEIDLKVDEVSEEDKEESQEKAVSEEEGKCANVNCEETLGRFSKCDENTGECHCHDVDDLDRPLIKLNGKCIINRQINDPCKSHEECSATIGGRAWCHMDVVTLERFCQCEMFHYFDESLKECLPFASDGMYSPCKTDMQCTGFPMKEKISGHGLGPNARCSTEKGQCECKLGPDGQKAFLYENYCFYQMMPGDPCTLNRECEVSFPAQDVVCLDGQCFCSSGENITSVSCPLDPEDVAIMGGSRRYGDAEGEGTDAIDRIKAAMGLDLPNFVFILIIGAIALLAVLAVILVVFIVRKQHKYSMVRTREPKEDPSSPL